MEVSLLLDLVSQHILKARVRSMKVARFNLQLSSAHHATAFIDNRDEAGRGVELPLSMEGWRCKVDERLVELEVHRIGGHVTSTARTRSEPGRDSARNRGMS